MVGDTPFDGHGRNWLPWPVIVVVVFSVLVSQNRAGTLALTGGQSLASSSSQRSGESFKSIPTSPETERRDQPVTEDDLRVLKRADEMLSTPATWNRHDTRMCKPHDKAWSLFCVMQQAALDVYGKERYRAVAIQEVRFVVEDLMKGKNIEHRLTDYNNLPSTRFADIKSVLKVASDRVAARLASQKK